MAACRVTLNSYSVFSSVEKDVGVRLGLLALHEEALVVEDQYPERRNGLAGEAFRAYGPGLGHGDGECEAGGLAVAVFFSVYAQPVAAARKGEENGRCQQYVKYSSHLSLSPQVNVFFWVSESLSVQYHSS